MNIKKKELVGVFLGLGALCALDCSGMNQCPIGDIKQAGSSVATLKNAVIKLMAAWPQQPQAARAAIGCPDAATLIGDGTNEEGRDVVQVLATINGLLLMQESGGRVLVGTDGVNGFLSMNNAHDNIGLYAALSQLCNGAPVNGGAYAQQVLNDPRDLTAVFAGSVIGAYVAFAANIGDCNPGAIDDAHGRFSARQDNQQANERTKNAMIAGLTPVNIRAYGVNAAGGLNANNGRLALYLGLTALAEIAEYGTIGGNAGHLDNGTVALGYTPEIIKAINAIIADLHN